MEACANSWLFPFIDQLLIADLATLVLLLSSFSPVMPPPPLQPPADSVSKISCWDIQWKDWFAHFILCFDMQPHKKLSKVYKAELSGCTTYFLFSNLFSLQCSRGAAVGLNSLRTLLQDLRSSGRAGDLGATANSCCRMSFFFFSQNTHSTLSLSILCIL